MLSCCSAFAGALWLLSLVPGAMPTPGTHRQHAQRPSLNRLHAGKRHRRDDDYAHVFYEFSRRRGFHVFVHGADGAEREITDEPDWPARHHAAVERLHQTRRTAYVQAHPEVDASLRAAILTGKLVPGMTTEQVRASAGDPAEENRALSRQGLLEEWRYGITLPHATGEMPLLDGQQLCAEDGASRNGRLCVLHFVDGVLGAWESPAESAGRENGRNADSKMP